MSQPKDHSAITRRLRKCIQSSHSYNLHSTDVNEIPRNYRGYVPIFGRAEGGEKKKKGRKVWHDKVHNGVRSFLPTGQRVNTGEEQGDLNSLESSVVFPRSRNAAVSLVATAVQLK